MVRVLLKQHRAEVLGLQLGSDSRGSEGPWKISAVSMISMFSSCPQWLLVSSAVGRRGWGHSYPLFVGI